MSLTQADIEALKASIDNTVEIETSDGERLVARIPCAYHDALDEHAIFYNVISSNMLDQYESLLTSGGYALDFDPIPSDKPLGCDATLSLSPSPEHHQ